MPVRRRAEARLDVGGEREERRVHVGGGLGRGLEEARAQLVGELLALRSRHRLWKDAVGALANGMCRLVRHDTLSMSLLLPRRSFTTCDNLVCSVILKFLSQFTACIDVKFYRLARISAGFLGPKSLDICK